MSKNEELETLYNKYWEQLIKNGNKVIEETDIERNHPANPLLLKVDEKKYASSDLKVMIFGQETRGWLENFGLSIKEGMDRYENFYVNENFYDGRKKSVYWKAFDFFKEEISKHHSDKEIIFIWNNISKIGRHKATGITKDIRALERKYFPVVSEEVKILKPDIVVFFTGNRNGDIQFHFQDVQFNEYQHNATLESKNGKRKFNPAYQVISKDLPHKSVKVYHPSYFGGFNNIKNDAIKFLCSDER